MTKPSPTCRQTLLSTCQSFCAALISPPPPSDLLSSYFRADRPNITEHAPDWARARLPFIANTFEGVEGCLKYFELLAATLEMKLPDDAFEGFVADAEAVAASNDRADERDPGIVSCVGRGEFKAKKSGESGYTNGRWSETFIYRFSDFDGEGRIGHWEIWADPLSAWDAVGETWEKDEEERGRSELEPDL